MSWIGGLTRGRPLELRKCRRRGPPPPFAGSFAAAFFRPFVAAVVRAVAAIFVVAQVEFAVASADDRFVGIETALAEVLGFDIADMEKAIAADAEIDEGGLNARFQIDNPTFVDVADVIVLAGPFNIKFFE
jgi:hypothetical protein